MRFNYKSSIISETIGRLERFQNKELAQWVSSTPNVVDIILSEFKISREDLATVEQYPSIKRGIIKWRPDIVDRHLYYCGNGYVVQTTSVIDGLAQGGVHYLDAYVTSVITSNLKSDLRIFLLDVLDLQPKHIERVVPQLKHLSPTFAGMISNLPSAKRNRKLPDRAQAFKDRYDGSDLFNIMMTVSLDDGLLVNPFENIIIK